MSRLREPGLGPIVGHTTDRTCRLWIRADDSQDKGATLASDRRTLGVLGVTHKNGGKIKSPPVYYFRLHREFDRTGTFNLGEDVSLDGAGSAYALDPDTTYRVRLGTLTVDDPFSDDESVASSTLKERLPDATVWRNDLIALPEKKAQAEFRTFPNSAKTTDRLSFIVGSCRYPGLFWKTKHADKIFGAVGKEIDNNVNGITPSFVLMVGDQIYADLLSRHFGIGLADTYEEFQDRYIKAFGSPNMRQLLRNVPTYMILDDHEIEDNWTQDRIRGSSKRMLFNLAIGAYMSYQWSHGPRSHRGRLYYNFDYGGYPFFVLDTRTQRFMDDFEDVLADNHMLGRPSLDPDEPSQLDLLLTWLKNQQDDHGNVPKFIVSSSVFVPNPMTARAKKKPSKMEARKMEGSDSWPAFPNTRRAILDRIVQNGIQNVVFLSGDIHCSNLAEMYFSGTPAAKKIKAFSITSSAFYWPFPFADGEPSDYVHDSKAKGQEDSFPVSGPVTMDYKAQNFTQEDNYCRVNIDRDKAEIEVQVFNSDGLIIEQEKADGKTRKLVGTLKLIPW